MTNFRLRNSQPEIMSNNSTLSTIQLAPHKHLEDMSRTFYRMYSAEQLTDVRLCCKNGTVKAHRIVLATFSPYFHRLFLDVQHHDSSAVVIVMYGVDCQQLRHLVDLMYTGSVTVLPQQLNAIYQLAEEFQLSHLMQKSGATDVSLSAAAPPPPGAAADNDCPLDGNSAANSRDTRFRGTKRVAVSFPQDTSPSNTNNNSGHHNNNKVMRMTANNDSIKPESTVPTPPPPSPFLPQKPSSSSAATGDAEEMTTAKLSAWAKKPRKYQCELCPSKFKRWSHLTRHQLVHTGERPFACNQCDKAFSRHDKLKHHVRKTHLTEYEGCLMTAPSSSSASITGYISGGTANIQTDPITGIVKRARGRPRLHLSPSSSALMHPWNTSTTTSTTAATDGSSSNTGENYDITNLPYGDLNYLTMAMVAPRGGSTEGTPTATTMADMKNVGIIEPLVEINTTETDDNNVQEPTATDDDDDDGDDDKDDDDADGRDTEGAVTLFTRITKIGECTISVAKQEKQH